MPGFIERDAQPSNVDLIHVLTASSQQPEILRAASHDRPRSAPSRSTDTTEPARRPGTCSTSSSVELARTNVKAANLDDRITIHHRDVSDPGLQARYDLVTLLEVLHDVAHPVELLENARTMTTDGGAVLVVDERVADTFVAPGDEIERMMYGWSVLCCLPSGMSEPNSAATGTVMRETTLRDYATQAGFAGVEVLPVDNDFFRLYRLHR